MSSWIPTFISPSPQQPTERVVRLRRRFALALGHGEVVRATLRTPRLPSLSLPIPGSAFPPNRNPVSPT
jgi:hypothetical protein